MSDYSNRQRGKHRAAHSAPSDRRSDVSAYSRSAYGVGRHGSSNLPGVAPDRRSVSTLDSAAYSREATLRRRRRSKKPFIVAGVVVLLLVTIAIYATPRVVASLSGSSGQSVVSALLPVSDVAAKTDEDAAYLATPIMAEADGVELHSAISMNNLTEILIHNASYGYALALTTELTEATNTDVMAAKGTGRIASSQPTGDAWMTGQFIRCFRSGNGGAKMSAIDCGAPVGTTVYAPVSGKVVLVKEYQLYDRYTDYQIHIQPEGRSDLDVVMIHLENVQVKAGDTVVAGTTPLAQIRDVYAYIGSEMQLKEYTADTDNGNHTHIQVNDITNAEYHGLDDLKS